MKSNLFIAIKDRALTGKMADGVATIEEVSAYLIENFPIGVIAKALAEIMIDDASYNSTPITVTQDEYDRICSLFRIRGLKMTSDGEIIRENRGRPTKKG